MGCETCAAVAGSKRPIMEMRPYAGAAIRPSTETGAGFSHTTGRTVTARVLHATPSGAQVRHFDICLLWAKMDALSKVGDRM